jgi:hypothetical protein
MERLVRKPDESLQAAAAKFASAVNDADEPAVMFGSEAPVPE